MDLSLKDTEYFYCFIRISTSAYIDLKTVYCYLNVFYVCRIIYMVLTLPGTVLILGIQSAQKENNHCP